DGGYGSGLLARIVGQKKAREIWFLCEQYDAQQAFDMGLVNKVVPLACLEDETVAWARKMLQHSPLALRMIKAGMNAADDGLAGIQQLAGDATLLYYLSEEAQEGRNAYVEKRKPAFSRFPKRPEPPPQRPARVVDGHPTCNAGRLRVARPGGHGCCGPRPPGTHTAWTGGARGSDRDPGRHQLRQRLL